MKDPSKYYFVGGGTGWGGRVGGIITGFPILIICNFFSVDVY